VKVDVQPRLDELARRCRDAGMALTPQRVAIFKELLVSEDHPSPEMLHQRIRAQMPTLSLATIYKTLDTLVELGMVEEVSPVGDVKRYDGNHQRHHHLVCTRCKSVTDFYDEAFDALAAPRKLGGFVADCITVQIRGLCAACSRSQT
jgi:Fur family peroxide stress response transcriptional regulator